jgi:hypothetical protein
MEPPRKAGRFIVAMVYDFVTKRLIHPVYLIGLASLAFMRLSKPVIANTDEWGQLTDWLAGFFV